MLEVRRDREIHHEDGGWFQARWHFSFDRYRDSRHMGIGPLRVLNHDRLEPGAVWPMHPHADVEGITYVWKGTFKHADSLGNNGTLRPGGIQLMTLGSGALHSEQNGSESEPMEFIQIWILPDTAGLTPAVQQRQFTKEERTNRLLKVIGPPGEGVVTVHQNASIFVSALTGSTEVSHELGEGRGGYLYLIDGGLRLGKQDLSGGDAVVFQDESSITLAAKADSELLLVDVPRRFTPVGVWAR